MKLPAKNSIKELIFDLDGTLWDASETYLKGWNEAFLSLDLPEISMHTLQSITGYKMDEILKRLFPKASKAMHNEIENAISVYDEKVTSEKGGLIYDQVTTLIPALSNTYKIAFVSNCQSFKVPAFMKHSGLANYFVDTECAGNTGFDKETNIQLLVERNNFEAPAYVGDTFHDYKTCKSINMPFIWAKYGLGKGIPATFSIDKFSDLKNLL